MFSGSRGPARELALLAGYFCVPVRTDALKGRMLQVQAHVVRQFAGWFGRSS